jgi:hypothetical protein
MVKKMAETNQQTLQIVVKYKDEGASKSLQSLRNDIEAVDKASRGQGFQQLSSVAQSMAALGQAASGLKNIGPSFQQTAQAAEDLFNSFKSFDLTSYQTNVKGLTDSLQGIGKAFAGFDKMASGMARMSKMASDPNLSKSLQNMSQQVVEFAKNVTTNISDDVLDRFSKLGTAMAGLSFGAGKESGLTSTTGAARSASAIFSNLGENIKKVVSYGYKLSKLPLKMILTPIREVGNGLLGMTQRFQGFLSGIGRIALYRAIRTGIKLVTSSVREGVNNLYIWAGMVGNSFKPTMDSLATSFLYLKNSIGAMVSPILDVVAPAFEYLVNKIVEVLNVFNQVIATITGASTWRKALRAPASYSDNISGLGHDAKDANDAVKELKRTILGFDEINKLEDATKTTVPKVNGSGATGLYAKEGAFSFTELPIGQKAIDIAEKLKKAWEKGDFTAIGTMLGEKIGNALLNVPWDKKIKPTVVKLAKSFGTLLNGMFDYTGSGGKAMWDGIAHTIYNAINTAVLGYVTFFDTVHWEGIGQGVGAALKKVLEENLDWGMIARGLAAFPNAVIDAVTGFTKQFTTQDFYNAGRNIGSTISKALTLIKWGGLFGNAVKIANGVLSALNGALENFDWSGVKNAILKGIKAVPKKDWASLGKNIGKAIFNVVNFGAKLVDTLVSALKSIHWGDLVKNIWAGIDKSVRKEYGSWGKAGAALAKWFGDNLDVISLVLAFSVGKIAFKALASNFATGVMTQLNLLKVPGTGVAMGQWVAKGLTIAAGVILAIDGIKTLFGHDFNKSSVSDNLLTLLKGAGELGLAGAAIGFTFGGPAGALVGTITGVVISIVVAAFKWDPFSEKTKKELANGLQKNIDQELADAQSYSASMDYNNANLMWGQQTVTSTQNRTVGAANTGSSVTSGVLSVSLKPTVSEADTKSAWNQLSSWWSKIVKKNKVAAFLTQGVTNKATDWWKSVQNFWTNGIKNKTAKAFSIAGIVNKASDWWKNVQNYWSSAINGKTAKQFTIAGIVNQARTWWSNVKTYWASATSGQKAKQFTIGGVYDHAKTWWGSVKGYWSSAIAGQTAKRFSVAGINNQAGTWWSNVKTYWSDKVKNNTASRFYIGGVHNQSKNWWSNVKTWWKDKTENDATAKFNVGGVRNKAGVWWSDVKDYWEEKTWNKSLKAYVEVKSTKTNLNSAWNKIKNYFADNPITTTVRAIVKKVSSTTRKAEGGVYKNGQWHPITSYASGGMPGSDGQIFIAREAGPELVGTIGGNTAVMNNDQIVSSVASGVARAVAAVMANGGGNMNEITIKVDSETLYRAVKRGERKASGRYGTAVVVG